MPDIFAPSAASVVRHTRELARVADLPRRSWTREEAEDLAAEMTGILKTPAGTMALRPVQALALYEVGTRGGLFAPMAVGSGKTIVSLLSPEVANAKRPLLLVPAKLLDKTDRDRRELSRHWRLPDFLRLMSYEWLGREQAADALEKFLPDFVAADECHRLSRSSSAVSRRVRRFFAAHRAKFVAMSGTVTKRSLHDYAHLLRWVFGDDLEQMPLPRDYHDLEVWADALDERKGQLRRAHPGALECLCDAAERERWRTDARGAARSAYRRRLVETPGVIATTESAVDATLTVRAVEPPVPEVVEQAFDKLRKMWRTPDDWPLADGMQVRRHAIELSLQFFYVWSPRPPDLWLEKRKAWAKFCRQVLGHSRTLDTELQVRRWAEARGDCEQLREWLAVKDSFEPNTVPVWMGDGALAFAADWAERERGIVWVEHVVFGERLERDFGLPYYGRQGRDRRGRAIEDHPPREPMAASIASSGEGRNLQAWSRNLVTSWPANGKAAEQLLGRTHREGQEADEVEVDVVVACAEHAGAFWQSVADCRYVEQSTGAPQKLLLAGIDVPGADEVAQRLGPRWRRDSRGE
jgi:hypothetical protein